MAKFVTSMTIDDAEHYTPEQRAAIIASYPAHEREARAKGIPTMGSGRIFPVTDESILCEPFSIPKHWANICGLDFGWDHPTAAAHVVIDRDTDRHYIVADYRVREQTPILHAAALKAWGDWLPWSWPHDGLNDTAVGKNLSEQYRSHGLNLLPERATFEGGSNSVEAGVLMMLDLMQTGRLKVFSTCGAFMDEVRLYHRKDGKIVKERDDVISAARYALMMKRFAETKRDKSGWIQPAQKWVA